MSSIKRVFKRLKLGILYITGVNRHGRSEEPEGIPAERETSAQTGTHLVFNALIQIGLIVAFALLCHHEQYPKTVSPPPYPGLGEPGQCAHGLFVVSDPGHMKAG